VFPTFLIGLREGLEASLVVGILIAYLVKSGHRDRLRPVWVGVGAAVVLSFAVGGALTFASEGLLQGKQGEIFAGVVSLVAVAFVTWMIFWMRRTARFLKTELQDKLAAALTVSSAALAVTSFLAVGREGLETSFFLWSAIQATGSSVTPVVGATLGLLSAVALGYLLYRRAVSLNLARFFTWTGAGLVLVAAGVLSYAVHDLQEGGLLPGLSNLAFDVSGSLPLSSWQGSLLHGILGFTPETSWLQLAAFVLYLVPVMVLFFAPARTSSRSAAVNSAGAGLAASPGPASQEQLADR
jgi:high-affinity iron transporter